MTRMRGEAAPYGTLIRILVFLPLLQTLALPWMPGLNSDTALMGTSAYRLIHHQRNAMAGETPYTGGLRINLMALSFRLFGVNRLALELPYAVFSSLTVLFMYLLGRELGGEGAGAVCALALSVCPWFVMRDQENWQCLMLAAALWLLIRGNPLRIFLAGVVMGLGCYEHQLTAIVPLSLALTCAAYHRGFRSGARAAALALAGMLAGFIPRILYNLRHLSPLYVQGFNSPSWMLVNAVAFLPHFLRIFDGSLVYLRNTGAVRVPVLPWNSIVFLGAAAVLLFSREWRRARPLVALCGFLYFTVFLVIGYTSLRYFLSALFAATLVTGLGMYAISKRRRRLGCAILGVFAGLNAFYLAANFFLEFAATGGRCTLFRQGNLLEASHHLVRTDVLYACLDGGAPVLVVPEPFIGFNLRFYDIENRRFAAVTPSLAQGGDCFFFVDYEPSKLGITVDPARFPGYAVERECASLRNFSVWKFTRKPAR